METKGIVFLPISLEELRTLISDSLKRELLNHSKSPPEPNLEFLSRREVAKVLKISLPTLTDYVVRSIIPAYRIGNNVRFRKDEVLNAFQKIQTTKHKKYNND